MNSDISQAPWVWEFISEFIDAGIDMQTPNQHGLNCWEAIDGRASSAGHLPAYAAIQANRSAKQLQGAVKRPTTHPRSPRRI